MKNSKNYDITVATSDGLQQIIVRGEGCALLSARELKAELEAANERIKQEYHKMNKIDRNYLAMLCLRKQKRHMEDLIEEEIRITELKKINN